VAWVAVDAARARDDAAQSPTTSPAPGLSSRWIQGCTGPTQYITRQRRVGSQLQDEALHGQHMPASLDSSAIGFAAADSVGPGDGDANEDAEDATQHLAEDNEGDVCHQKAPRTVDKGVQKAAWEAAEAAWERHDVHELAAQSQTASAGKPKKIIQSDIINLFVVWELYKQSGVLLCGQHVSQMSVPDVLAAWVRTLAFSPFFFFSVLFHFSDTTLGTQPLLVTNWVRNHDDDDCFYYFQK